MRNPTHSTKSSPVQAPTTTFALRGRSQPIFARNEMRLIVPDATKAALDARLKTLDESKGKLTRLRMRDGVIVHAEFILWYGNHGLFYVPADHMTVAVWVLDLPGML